jgi:magnesium and cobalt transporter
VSGKATLVLLSEQFDCEFTDAEHEQFETIGGLVAHQMGHVPRKGEEHIVAGLKLVVLLSSSGTVKWFRATRIA